MKTALLYIRVSTNMQKQEGHSPKEQEENLIQYAKVNGYEILEVISDNGRSGRSAKSRPGFQRMMKIVRNGGCDAVIVNELNRFARSIKDTIISIEEMHKNGVDFISRQDNFDTKTAIGKAMLAIIATLAELESNQKSERIKESHAFAIKEGRRLGQLPIGKKRLENGQVVEDEREQKIIKLVRKLHRKDNLSYQKICNVLMECGIENKSGRVHWVPTQITRIMAK